MSDHFPTGDDTLPGPDDLFEKAIAAEVLNVQSLARLDYYATHFARLFPDLADRVSASRLPVRRGPLRLRHSLPEIRRARKLVGDFVAEHASRVLRYR